MSAAVCALDYATSKPQVMPAGTIKRIHVNQHMIRRNKKNGTKESVITIQWRNKSYRVKTVHIHRTSQAIYRPEQPLSCGAHVWVETTAKVTPVYA
jgi:hypothetical protein